MTASLLKKKDRYGIFRRVKEINLFLILCNNTQKRKEKKLNIILLGGFLGSGKTTILIQLAHYIISKENPQPGETKVMIIENEIGEVGVDNVLLESGGLTVQNLFAGCACCTSSGTLLVDIANIRDEYNPSWIIIEATGVAYPKQIQELIKGSLGYDMKILSLADASRWERLRKNLPALIDAQVDCADCVLINKADLVDQALLDEIAADIKEANPGGKIYFTNAKEQLDEEIWSSIVD